MSNEKLSSQFLSFAEGVEKAVEEGIVETSKAILRESVADMRKFPNDIVRSRFGNLYYKTKNTTNTLRILTGSLKRSFLQASLERSASGGVFDLKKENGDTSLLFGSEVQARDGEYYPFKLDEENSRFAFFRRRIDPIRYEKAIVRKVNAIRV